VPIPNALNFFKKRGFNGRSVAKIKHIQGRVSHKSDKVSGERVRTPIWESVKQKIQGRVSHKSDKVSGEKVKTPIWESVKQTYSGESVA